MKTHAQYRSVVGNIRTAAGPLGVMLVAVAGTGVALAQPAPQTVPGMPPAQAPGTAEAATPPSTTPAKQSDVKVDENNVVDLHVNDEDLGRVLEMLSIQSQKNIIASKSVSARVTANLYGVTFGEALDAILHVNGYTWVEQGNFIYVYTMEEARVIANSQRQRVSKMIPLNYIASTDAAEFVKPLLSTAANGMPGGEIKVNGKTANFPSIGETPMGNEEYASHSMLVVYDYEENVNEIEALVKQIDTRPAQVLVEATILQTDLTESNAFGVDFSIIGGFNFQDLPGSPLGAAQAIIGGRSGTSAFPADGEGRAVTSTVGNTTSGPAGLKVGIIANDVSVFLRVLDEVTDTTILSNPKILALNRQASRVLIGRKVGYISSTSTETSTTQTVQFLDTGTQLYFRPFVNNDGSVRMELKPQVSEAVIREANGTSGAPITIPDEITNELVTNVIVRDGQTIVLGGLFRESTETTRRQVPILGDIPIVGEAFRGHDDTVKRNEIIFMITPNIMNDATASDMGKQALATTERARVGARNGTLWFGRDRMTSRMNVEAEELAQEGKTDKALWYLNWSLSNNPVQPDAIALREKLSNKKSGFYERSMLQRIVAREARSAMNTGNASGQNTNTDFSFNFNAPATTTTTASAQGSSSATQQAGTPTQQPVTDTCRVMAGPNGMTIFSWASLFNQANGHSNSTAFTSVPEAPSYDTK